MNRKQILIALTLIAFLAIDAEAIYAYGYLGFFRTMLATGAGVAALVDLVVALGLICLWMSEDARSRGINALPYVLLTLALGSAGPLAYLIRRFADAPETSVTLGVQPLRG